MEFNIPCFFYASEKVTWYHAIIIFYIEIKIPQPA